MVFAKLLQRRDTVRKLLSKCVAMILLFILACFPIFAVNDANTQKQLLNGKINLVPIAMATDDNYTYPTAVTMASILENKSKNTKIDFNIMISGKFKEENRLRLKKFETIYKNCSVNLIDMQNAFGNAYVSRSRLSTAAYYRLNLPSLLPSCDKIIYLDGDIIVTKDLLQMYNIDLENNYLGGVIDVSLRRSFESSPKFSQSHAKKLGIPDVNGYINSGVLTLNLKKMREDNLESTFGAYLIKNPKLRYNDQDVLNATCYGKIKLLPKEYNVFCRNYITDPSKATKYSCDNPTVIHYVGDNKPWKNGDCAARSTWEKYSKTVTKKIYNGVNPYQTIKVNTKKIAKKTQTQNKPKVFCKTNAKPKQTTRKIRK